VTPARPAGDRREDAIGARAVPARGIHSLGEELRERVLFDLARFVQVIDDRDRHLRVVGPPPDAARLGATCDERFDPLGRAEKALAERVPHGQSLQRKQRSARTLFDRFHGQRDVSRC